MSTHRRRRRGAIGLLAALLVGLSACSATAQSVIGGPAPEPTDSAASAAPTTGKGNAAGTPTSPTAPSSRPPSSTSPSSTAPSSTPPTSTPPSTDPPDFFTPTKLGPGERPPQFIVLSFDGVGWHEKWQRWFEIADQVPLRFTGFLTGLYLLDEAHRDAYTGPGHERGDTSLGAWNAPTDVVAEINDLNTAYGRGMEIGTHFNGHFCDIDPPGANQWTTADWNDELDQFFTFVRDYKQITGIPGLDNLDVPAESIRGSRTPCLEGRPDQLMPALHDHHFSYDSSVTRNGIAWPVQSDGIWQLGMPTFAIAGTDHQITAMDYNFWYTLSGATETSPEKAAQDTRTVLQTYRDMYRAAYDGNRAPIVLGNHFEEWNHGAYSHALEQFALETCGKPDTYCVPFRDVVSWMELQDPATLAALQALPPETGP